MPSYTNTTYTGVQSIDYVTYDPDKEVTDLQIDNNLVIDITNLSWTHPTTPGTYEVWYYEGTSWIDSGSSTTGTSISVDLPKTATKVQIRNGTQTSNDVPIIYKEEAPDINILATNRYDGVKISWTPFVEDNIEITRGSTIIYQGPASSYYIDTGATGTSANYTAYAYIGTKPTDFVDSATSNTVSGFKLTAPPYPEPNPIAADCFLGIKPGTGIVDTGTDELGDPVPFIPAEGRFVISESAGLESDILGTSFDLDDTTLFHSDNEYVFVDTIIELTSYTSGTGIRTFALTSELITALETGALFLARFTVGETSHFAQPIFKRSAVSSDTFFTDTYSLNDWWFSGGGQETGHYLTGHTDLVIEGEVDIVKLYFLNLTLESDILTYNSRTKTNLQMTPQVGGPGEVYMDGDYFRVNGIDFGTLNFLCNLGKSTDGNFVSGLRNVYDDVLPIGDGTTVDPALIHYGNGSCLQVLGSYPGASGWFMDFENGRIWREAAGNEIDWWNAAKGRTRLKYEGSSSLINGTDPYVTEAVNIGILTPNNEGADPVFRVHNSSVGMTPVTQVLADVTLDMDQVYDTSIFGVSVTPKDWTQDDEGNYGYGYLNDKQTVIFSNFEVGVDFVPIYTYYRHRTSTPIYLSGGEPWFPHSYTIIAYVHMARTSTYTFRLYYTYSVLAKDGSVAEVGSEDEYQDGIQLRIPAFSYSFLQMR